MTDAAHTLNASAVAAELEWLGAVIEARLTHFFAGETDALALPPVPMHGIDTALGASIKTYALDVEARLVQALALAPHVNSAVLDPFYVKNSAIDRVFSQFGGHQGPYGFQPTTETALFLVAGTQTQSRIAAMRLLDPDHPLRRFLGLQLNGLEGNNATPSTLLDLAMHRVITLCNGVAPKPDFSPSFPAKRLTTKLDWADLVLSAPLLHQLGSITSWLTHRDKILKDWNLERQFGGGFKALFYGPPGTGKTLTATLLGKQTGLDVYRIDLSMVVSKYIGETEKNLGLVFDMAAEREWILFFDEADALFGARTATSSSNDRYANQEVSYLLQRIEDCESLVILATNLRSNIDDAFFRRFQMALGFTRPDEAARRRIWQGIMQGLPVGPDVDINGLARAHELTGGAISNVVRHAAITALRRESEVLAAADFKEAIQNEMRKEGRTS